VTAWAWPGSRVARVVDGDTLDALVTRDIGFGGRVTYPVRLRLARVNAPAGKSAAGKESSAFLAGLLPAGAVVDLVTVKPYKYSGPADDTGEYMTEITLPDGRNVSDVMVATGHAVSWDGEGPRPNDG
jgi:endonuclease YncB( thermonuclease family)